MLNPKAIIPARNEALLAAAWKLERNDYRPRREPAKPARPPVNKERVARGIQIRKDVLACVQRGIGDPRDIAAIVGVHVQTARTHLKALAEIGKVAKGKRPHIRGTHWRAVE